MSARADTPAGANAGANAEANAEAHAAAAVAASVARGPLNAASATHEVFNQSQPLEGLNLFAANLPLQDALRFNDPVNSTRAWPALQALGAELGLPDMQTHARLANHHGPTLHSHDRQGRRLDEVEFHPSYHHLMAAACRHGLHGTAWSTGPGGHIARAAAFMLFTELEPSVLCPISMSYAVMPALKANAAIHAQWAPGLASRAYDPRSLAFDAKSGLTMGMGMTEKQGGSDVRANTTRAEPDGVDAWGARYRITGHKWFFSAPMCDAFLVLAQAPGGLSCFFMPRWLPQPMSGGATNGLQIQRLKNKLGNHANASSEVEFHAATAWLVGLEGRGIAQILAMGAMTRLDCALGTAGLMRAALSLALHHCAQRQAFGKALIEQPLMKNVLADLALESEAATALAMRLARAIDRTENEPSAQHPTADAKHERLMRRVLTPVAKFWVCKRGSAFAQEAMECLGGNGFVEAQGGGVMARIYREMPLNSIWEGAGNIMALDLLRALRGPDVVEALAQELAPLRGTHPAAKVPLNALLVELTLMSQSADQGDAADEAQARRLASQLAVLLQASLLLQQAPGAVFDAFCASRLQGGHSIYGSLPSGLLLDAILLRAMPWKAG